MSKTVSGIPLNCTTRRTPGPDSSIRNSEAASFGTHRAMTQEEVGRKLGPEIARNYAWLNHDAFDNIKEVALPLGATRFC